MPVALRRWLPLPALLLPGLRQALPPTADPRIASLPDGLARAWFQQYLLPSGDGAP